jgi:predicted TIM-barrel fold metal-dependent hydrolase
MWGSDWPVSTLASSYGDGLRLLGDDTQVLAWTAIETYGLELP